MEIENLFEKFTGCRPEETALLSASGSNRRYWRLTGGGCSLIGAEGTEASENRAFVALSEHFRSKGVNVPEVFAVSDNGMAYLQEDLGRESLYDAVASGRETGEYSEKEKALLTKVISQLPDIQFLGAEGLDFNVCWPEPEFGRRLVTADLNYFKYCFLKTTGVSFNEVRLEDDFSRLATELLSENQTAFMYRDFQARNVMLKDGTPYFIDFQGGMRGPVYYDVASFVWQARAGYPDEFRRSLVGAYMEALGKYVHVDERAFSKRLGLFVLLRTLQVLGAYGFRGKFERKPHFLESIPYAVANLRSVLVCVPEECGYLRSVLESVAGLPQAGLSADAFPASLSGLRGPGLSSETGLEVLVTSFSFRKGLPEDPSGNGGGYVFDCRALPNPGKYEYYRQFTGMDREVEDFFIDKPEMPHFLESVFSLADAHLRRFLDRGFTHMMISFGCTGGQHRSVYCAERTARHLAQEFGVRVRLVHREQNVTRTY